MVEITEQAAVDDYTLLNEQLEPWMHSRVRFAIDDTGAGYSSLRHVIELSPDFLKLDRSLIHGIDKDGHRNVLVRALVALHARWNQRDCGRNQDPGGAGRPARAEVPLGQDISWRTRDRPGQRSTRSGARRRHPLIRRERSASERLFPELLDGRPRVRQWLPTSSA